MGKKFVGLGGLKHFWTKAKTWIAEQITAEVTAKIAELVANAPEDLDTLKEIADWISTHANDASAMNTQINTNKDDIAALQTSVAGKADTGHTHDDRYFTETEVTSKLAGKSDTGHKHSASDITSGVLPVANGGTGCNTAQAAADELIANLPASNNVPVDTDYVISQVVNGGPFLPAYQRRPVSKLWEYIKGKISSVLGLTKDNYGGKAASAGTADNATSDANGNNIVNTYATKTELEKTTTKSASLSTVTTGTTKYIKLGTFHWYDSFSFSCRLAGNCFEDGVNINILNGNTNSASVCGYYSTNSRYTKAVIVKRGDSWNSDIEIYLQVYELTNISIDVTIYKDYQDRINISESTTAPSGTLEVIVFNNLNGMFSGSIEANNKMVIPIGEPSSLEDGCIWIQ